MDKWLQWIHTSKVKINPTWNLFLYIPIIADFGRAILLEKNSVSAASLELHIFLDFSPHCTMIKIRSTACVIWTMGRRHAHIDTPPWPFQFDFFIHFRPSFKHITSHKNTFTFPMLCCQKDADCSLDPKPQNLGNGQMIPSSLITWIIKLEEVVCP